MVVKLHPSLSSLFCELCLSTDTNLSSTVSTLFSQSKQWFSHSSFVQASIWHWWSVSLCGTYVPNLQTLSLSCKWCKMADTKLFSQSVCYHLSIRFNTGKQILIVSTRGSTTSWLFLEIKLVILEFLKSIIGYAMRNCVLSKCLVDTTLWLANF